MNAKPTEMTSLPALAKSDIGLVDGQPLFRFGLSMLVSRELDLSICWEASDEEEAIRRLQEHRPTVMIVELMLKAGNGIDLIKRIRQIAPDMGVLVLSTHEDEYYVERALRAGASGYMMKREAGDRVLLAIRKMLAGQTLLSDNLSSTLLKRLITTRADGNGSCMQRLSDRELQIYSMIGTGKASREIADELHLSAKTVETYLAHIKRKLGIGDGRKLVHHAVRWTLAQEAKLD